MDSAEGAEEEEYGYVCCGVVYCYGGRRDAYAWAYVSKLKCRKVGGMVGGLEWERPFDVQAGMSMLSYPAPL